jgi:hypothetical protein
LAFEPGQPATANGSPIELPDCGRHPVYLPACGVIIRVYFKDFQVCPNGLPELPFAGQLLGPTQSIL